MKKILLFACAVAAIACAKEAPVQENTPVDENKTEMITVTFTASVNETKATVSDGGAFTWKTGDRIAVYDENTRKFYPFDLSSGNGENTATFSGQFDAADYKFTKAYYPGNPFDYSATYSNAEEVTIPSIATHSTQGLIPLAGTVTGTGTLSFDYLTAVVKVSVDRIPRNTQYAVLKATNNIAGTFNLSSKTITSNGSKEIALNTNGVTGPQTFVFPVPAGSNAVTFELRDGLHGAALFTTGSENAKTVTFKAPSLYYNNVTVPVCVYVNYSEPWVDGETPYIYFRGNEAEAAGYDSGYGWPGSVIPSSGNYDVAHLAIGYRKVAYDLASVNTNSSTTATMVVHINWDNSASGEPYGDLYRIEVPNVDITNDLFITVRPVSSQGTSKIYFRNWSSNGWITKVWAAYNDNWSNITDAWPGTSLDSMSSENLGRSQYPYITADSGRWIEFKGVNNDGSAYNPNNKVVEVKDNKNTLVTLRDDDNTTAFDFGIAEVTFN